MAIGTQRIFLKMSIFVFANTVKVSGFQCCF